MTSAKPEAEQKPHPRSRFGMVFKLALLLVIYLLSPGPIAYIRYTVHLAESEIGPGPDHILPGHGPSLVTVDSTDERIRMF